MAHGSADPRAAAATRALDPGGRGPAARAGRAASYLDHAGPRPTGCCSTCSASGPVAVVVPLLLTAAFHGRVDLPGVSTRVPSGLASSADDRRARPVGGFVDPLLLAALRRQLPAVGLDGVVMVAAGTRDDLARHTVDLAAAALGQQLGVPCRAAFASGSPVTGAVAVSALRSQGCSQIAISSYFLATGKLHETAVASAVSAGALAPAAPPLGRALDLARLVVARVGREAAETADLAA